MNPLDDPNDACRWIDRFLRRYQRQVAPFGAMTDGDMLDFVAAWVAAFRSHGITEGEANAAALQLAQYPPQYTNRHLPAVLEVVRQSRSPTTSPADATAADRARRQREAMKRAAKEDQLAARWESLPEAEREAIRAEVIAENPGLKQWEHFVRSLCLARLEAVRA